MWRESSSVKTVNLVKKIFYNNWDNEFFIRDCFLLAHPVHISRWWQPYSPNYCIDSNKILLNNKHLKVHIPPRGWSLVFVIALRVWCRCEFSVCGTTAVQSTWVHTKTTASRLQDTRWTTVLTTGDIVSDHLTRYLVPISPVYIISSSGCTKSQLITISTLK